MNRIISALSVVFIFLSMPFASWASGQSDMEERLAELIAEVEDLGYIVVHSEVNYLSNNSDSREFYYPVELEPGSYVILAECEDNIRGLGLGVWSLEAFANGRDPYLDDVNDENLPFLSLTASGDGTCVIGVWGTSFRRRSHDSYYCILWAMEPDEEGDSED